MEILETEFALLSNHEVFALLRQNRHKTQDENTLEYELIQYLKSTPACVTTSAQMTSLLKSLQSWGLTKAEKLNIINIRPTSVVELVPLIEEANTRFSDQQMQDLLDLLDAELPFTPTMLLTQSPAVRSASLNV